MPDMYETQPEVGRLVMASNEHLIPFGSTAGPDRRIITKHPSGWFTGDNAFPYAVLGSTIRSLGDGGLETLDQFRMRARATILARMNYESVSGYDAVKESLDSMDMLDVDFVPGMPVGWPLDYTDERTAHMLVGSHIDPKVRFVKSADAAYATVPQVAILQPVNDAEMWTGEQGSWVDWVRTKRLLWEAGQGLAESNGWCGTFANVMSGLGIDANFYRAAGAVRDDVVQDNVLAVDIF